MKRLFTILALLFLFPAVGTERVFACDFCSCLMGINPYYSDSHALFVSLLRQRSDASGTGHDSFLRAAGFPAGTLLHADGEGESLTETRWTLELGYRHRFSEHLLATVLLPMSNVDLSGDENMSVRGIGDVTLLGHYVITELGTGTSTGTLLLGGGVTLPTGLNNVTNAAGERLDPDLQPGSGAVDLVMNVLGTAQLGEWMAAVDLYGSLNGGNSRGDRFGNALAISAAVNRDLYRDNAASFALVGIAGVRQEMAAKDVIEGVEKPASGFSTTYAVLGGEAVLGQWRIDLKALAPLLQVRPDGASEEALRLSSGIRYQWQ